MMNCEIESSALPTESNSDENGEELHTMLAAAKAARARRPVKRTRVLAAVIMLGGTNWGKNRRVAPARRLITAGERRSQPKPSVKRDPQ